MIGILRAFDILLFLIGIVLIILPRVLVDTKPKPVRVSRLDTAEPIATERGFPWPQRTTDLIAGILIALSIIGFICLSGSAQVKGTEVGVIHNQLNGNISALDPGLRVWPLSSQLKPFVTDVETYSTRKQRVEVGDAPALKSGVPAASGTVGNPTVYFAVQFWSQLNPVKVVELHKRYGPTYLDRLVKQAATDAVKAVQGKHPYDYVAGNREAFTKDVQLEIQKKLVDADGLNFVTVSDVQVIDYDYDESVNKYLDTLSQKQFELQSAERDQEIATAKQDTAKINADTDYNVRTRAAQGDAQVVKTKADGDAYATKAQYNAEAEGIGLIEAQLSDAPEGYIRYVTAKSWDGKMPGIFVGDSADAPFLSVLPIEATPTP